jgi:hypothetical protein
MPLSCAPGASERCRASTFAASAEAASDIKDSVAYVADGAAYLLPELPSTAQATSGLRAPTWQHREDDSPVGPEGGKKKDDFVVRITS